MSTPSHEARHLRDSRELITEPVTVTSTILREWRLPEPEGDKESRGRTLIVGGSDQTPGAVLLAAEAALRSGAGKLQVATVASLAQAVAVALPEALVLPLPERGGDIAPEAADDILGLAEGASSVLLGPGIRDIAQCRALMAALMPRLRGPVVIDAAATAYVGADHAVCHPFEGRAVLTPNRKELALTLGIRRDEVEEDPAGATLELARRTLVTVTSGGEESWTATPDGDLWRDQTGGVGLGVSGSGDVFAGIVCGLTARGATPPQAAVWAAHLHGRAGDRLASAVGRVGFLARELPAEVPRVLAEIEI
jgi:ADP-dependent NAD(P)H-hydrate dehydratase